MLTIRAEQMEALREGVRRRFEQRMLLHLRSAFPRYVEGFSEDELRALVRSGMERAEGYGISSAPDVARFIEYLLCRGPRFDRVAAVSRILRARSLGGAAKMDLVDAWDRADAAE